jgi:hypothetical protein
MDWDQFFKDFQALWQDHSRAVLLLVLGILVFVFLVVDAWFHKRRRKKPRLH